MAARQNQALAQKLFSVKTGPGSKIGRSRLETPTTAAFLFAASQHFTHP